MPLPLVFLFNLDTPRGAKIRRMCLPLKIRTCLVPKQAHGLPLSSLVESPETVQPLPPEQEFEEELLLLTGFTGPQLNAFLEGFRRNHIPPVALKAVLTEHNQDWTAAELRAELQKEREALAQGGSAHTP